MHRAKVSIFDHVVGARAPYMRSTVTQTCPRPWPNEVPAAAQKGLRHPQGHHEKNSGPAQKHAPTSKGNEKGMLPPTSEGGRRDSHSRRDGRCDDVMRENRAGQRKDALRWKGHETISASVGLTAAAARRHAKTVSVQALLRTPGGEGAPCERPDHNHLHVIIPRPR